jgi:hypothetical protein
MVACLCPLHKQCLELPVEARWYVLWENIFVVRPERRGTAASALSLSHVQGYAVPVTLLDQRQHVLSP